MRMRTITGATLAAGALTATLTGAASAGTPADAPPGDAVIVTCRDGERTERRVTGADRERIEEMRERAGGSPDGKHREIVHGAGDADRGSPGEHCADRS